MIRQRIKAETILLVVLVLYVDLYAGKNILLTPNQPPAATKTLSFPPAQCMGNLSLEPESGPGWEPEGVCLSGNWPYLNAKQGDVLVPEDRNIKLFARLALSPQESARMRAQNPLAYQRTIADRVRNDPYDLSGLLALDPNDLFWLSVCTEMYLRTDAPPRIFEPIRHLTGLRILTLFGTGISDEGLECLRSLRSLRGLELTQTSIGDRGLAALKDLPALEYLQLGTGVTDAGLKQVAQVSSLRWLNIAGGKMWGPGLAELVKLPRLERLCFWSGRGGSPSSDRHIEYLESLTQLKGLSLHGVDALTDASLTSIGKLKNLEELYFLNTRPRLTVAGVAHLKDLKKLKKLHFAQTWTSREGMDHGDEIVRHLAALPNLESLKGISYLTAEGMKTLAAFRKLRCLTVDLKTLGLGYHGPTGLSYLAGLGSLEELSISSGDTMLSGADVANLEPLPRLRDLSIHTQNLTDQALASIGRLKQLEGLRLSCVLTHSALNQLNGLSNLQKLEVNAWPRRNAAEADPTDALMLDLSGLRKMNNMRLSGLPLQDSDLASLKHLPLLENLTFGSDALTGACLRHLQELRELERLSVSGLNNCTGEDLAHLNGLAQLKSLTVAGDISNSALASLTGLSSLESLHIETDNPIRKQTVSDQAKSHPVIEFIHISEQWKTPTGPPQQRERSRVSQPRTNRRAPAKRRRERR